MGLKLRMLLCVFLLVSVAAGCDSKSDLCIPACEGRQCGIDSLCGQNCGPCPLDETCDEETGRCQCVPDCANRACGPDHCGGSCGECQAPLSCSPEFRCEGEVGQGAACGRGLPGGAIATCAEGLTCLEVVFEPGAMPCTTDGDCLAFYQPDWNPVCVAGDCVASLCVDGCAGGYGPDWCPDGFDPLWDDEREECLCVPVGSSTGLLPGSPCTLGPVNPGAGNCQVGTWCWAFMDQDLPTCAAEQDCVDAGFEFPGLDCVAGHCMVASCVEPCTEDCPGFQGDPEPYHFPCYCDANYLGTQAAGEPCAFEAVNAEAGDCIEGLSCLGLAPDTELAPCPNGDSDCSGYTDPGLNPDCVEGGCGASFCSARCEADGSCEDGFSPQTVGGSCYCIPSPLYCDNVILGDPCAFEDVVNVDAGPCQCDLTCLGTLPDPQGPACADDVDCRDALGEIYNPECVGGRCGTSYCATTCHEGVCDSGFEPQDFGGVCYCVPGVPVGSQDLGDPCTYGPVNEGAGYCLAGLGCIGMAPDPVNAPCPNGDADCAAFMDAQWNAECVDGGCGASLCAARCVDGACPDCGPAVTVSGECYCGLMGSVDPADREAGEACVWDVVNQDPCIGNCEASLNCLGMAPDPIGMPCVAEADCLAFLPESWNVDCVDGGCGASFCSEECIGGACHPGFGPSVLANGDCYCIPAANDTPRCPGEPCTFVLVNVLAGVCAEGLACAGVLSEEGAAPCPNGDADCLAFYNAGWNPDCTGGRCGASFCAVPCVAGACDAGLTPVDVGGTCYCRASK